MTVKDYVTKIEQLTLNRAYNNCGFVSTVIVNALINKEASLIDFEKELRARNSRIHLVAHRMTVAISAQGFYSALPGSSERLPYFLWVSMDQKDMLEQLKFLSITKEENLARLQKTGFLNLIVH